MNTANPKQDLKKIYRFFNNRVPKYILLVVDDQRILNYIIIQVQIELKKQGKEIAHLKLKEDSFSIFYQVKEFLAGNSCDGLVVSHIDALIYRQQKETIDMLNKSRDGFEKFQVPIIFALNNDNLKKIINGAADFYQLRDLPDFHFEGTMIEDREILNIPISQIGSYADSSLKAELLEEQLKIIIKKKKIDKDSLNNIVMPLLNIYIDKGYYNKMEDLFNRFVKGKEDLVKNKMLLGDYYAAMYDYDKALSYYKKEVNYFESSRDKKGVAECYHQIGKVYGRIGDYDKALMHLEKSREIKEEMNDLKGISYILQDIGIIYQHRGNYEKSLDYFQRSLKIKEDIGDMKALTSSLHHLGILHMDKREYTQALMYFEKEKKISEEYGYKKGISLSLHEIGLIYYYKKNYNEALKYYEKSRAINEKISYLPGISANLHAIGMICQDKNEYERSLKYYKESLEIKEKIGDIRGVSHILHQLGVINHKKQNYSRALKNYEKSLQIKKKLGDNVGIANSLAQLGKLYFDKNEYLNSLKFNIQAYVLFSRLKSPDVERVKGDIEKVREKLPEEKFNQILKEFNINLD